MAQVRSKAMPYQQIAKIIGGTYLILVLLGVFSQAAVRTGLVSHTDASLTTENILKSELLFRLGIVSDILVLFGDIVIAVLLYFLLRPYSKPFAVLAMAFRMAVVAVLSVNVLNMLSVLLLTGGSDYLSVFSTEQLESTVLFLFKLHSYDYDLALALFSVHCLFIGLLFSISRIIPMVFSIALFVTACCYFIFAFGRFLFPEITNNLYPIILLPPLITELSLALWLLIKGVQQTGSNVL